MSGPIDRENKDDVLKQIGRCESDIEHMNRQQAKIDQEINGWPKRLEYLKFQKIKIRDRISKKHKYINELESDLNQK